MCCLNTAYIIAYFPDKSTCASKSFGGGGGDSDILWILLPVF